ncbi:hypothetical protein [Bradyrhizobium sp. SZCCHNR2032]|uniref:hypothetical protein n=1 Tax=Bradyrhizobium sp. SZCCHNR2032 TaxID=3057384 RepID=UPI0029165048|nr:hypothetical protein [Bradyrhizobium sp. SZCCHNR2032]
MSSEKFRERVDEVWSEAALRSIQARTRSKDHAGLIIDVHLRLEHTIVEILLHRLPKPDDLGIDGLDFFTKTNVASACGFIPHRKAILYIGNIRNKVAHRLDYKVTHDIADHLDKCAWGIADADFDDGRKSVLPLRRFIHTACCIGGKLCGWGDAALVLNEERLKKVKSPVRAAA